MLSLACARNTMVLRKMFFTECLKLILWAGFRLLFNFVRLPFFSLQSLALLYISGCGYYCYYFVQMLLYRFRCVSLPFCSFLGYSVATATKISVQQSSRENIHFQSANIHTKKTQPKPSRNHKTKTTNLRKNELYKNTHI